MNTLAETPDSSHLPDFSVQPTAATAAVAEIRTIVVPNLRRWNLQRVKDLLVMIYAYGLLGFGIGFPLALAAWAKLFWPEVG